MEIKTKLCNRSNYGGKLKEVLYIVIHYTSNEGDTAKNNADYFAREALEAPASAHYFVDEKEIWCSVPVTHIAYHCGAKVYVHPECRNSNSIGVEMCLTGKGMAIRQATIDRTVQFVRELMAQYNVPLDHVLRHYDVTGKYCPGPFVGHPSMWQAFQKALAGEQEEEVMKVYKYVPEMPKWAQDTFTRLVQSGYIAKDEKGEIDVQESTLQPVVYLDRLTGGKIEKLPELMKDLEK